MVTDPFIQQYLERIDEYLELSLQQLSLSLSPKQHNKDEEEDLQSLQEKLQKIKLIVAKIHASLRSHSSKVVEVDYATVLDLLSDLPREQFIEHQNGLINLVTNAIYQYTLLLCYYTLKSECVSFLPEAYESARYYKRVSDSKLWSTLYFVQTLPNKIAIFSRQLNYSFKKLKAIDASSEYSAEKLKILGHNFLEDVKPKWNKMMMVHDFRFVGLPKKSVSWAYFFLNLPRAMIRDELHKKIDYMDHLTKNYTTKLGQLIISFESGSKSTISDDYRKHVAALQEFFNGNDNDNIYSMVQHTMQFRSNVEKICDTKPSIATRYWPCALLVLTYGPSSIISIWQSRFKILHFLQENVVDFAMGLIYNWIYIPLKNVWATVRHDDDSSIAMMSAGTLDSEINSLTRMIVSFVKEKSNSNIDVDTLVQQIEHGDLTDFMEIYENQLEKPIKNIVTGGLIRSLLIQVQKTKVEGSLALNGIDKMLQSQQLVFGVVAISPALLILYVTTTCVYRLIKVGNFWSNIEECKQNLGACLNNVERLLNYDESAKKDTVDNCLAQGLLTIEISSIARYGSLLVPRSRLNEWYRDVEEISDSQLSNSSRINVINRIYHVYGRFF